MACTVTFVRMGGVLPVFVCQWNYYSFAFCDRVRLGKPRVLFQKSEELAGKMAEESPLISAEFLAELSTEVQKIELLC